MDPEEKLYVILLGGAVAIGEAFLLVLLIAFIKMIFFG